MNEVATWTLYSGCILLLLSLWPGTLLRQIGYIAAVVTLSISFVTSALIPAEYKPKPIIPHPSNPVIPTPVVIPVDAFGTQVISAFMNPPAPGVPGTKEDAQILAALFDGYARWLVYDGTLPKPVVTNTRDFGTSFANLQQNVMLMDKPFKDKYSSMELLITAQLRANNLVPKDTVINIDSQKRNSIASIFAQVSAALRTIK